MNIKKSQKRLLIELSCAYERLSRVKETPINGKLAETVARMILKSLQKRVGLKILEIDGEFLGIISVNVFFFPLLAIEE